MLISSSLYSGKQIKVVIRDGDTVIETDIMPRGEALQFAEDLRSAADDIESLVKFGRYFSLVFCVAEIGTYSERYGEFFELLLKFCAGAMIGSTIFIIGTWFLVE